jgi:serine/threonine-protein kinase
MKPVLLYPTLVLTAVACSSDDSQVSAGGGQTCGRTSESRVYCWGRNEVGQVGDGTTNQRLTPTPVATP